MPVFDYQVINKQGKEKKGVIEADSQRAARSLLREQGFLPIEVKEVSGDIKQARSGSGADSAKSALLKSLPWEIEFVFISNKNKLSVAELALITRQLATLLSSGLPIDDALLAVSEQSDNAKISRIMSAVRAKVMEGHSLSVSMSDYKQAFPELYRATINAGEHSGHLDKVLDSLADYIEKQYYFKQKIRQASIYPSLMILVSTTIVIFLLIYVVPKMVDVFKDTGHQLPVLTVGLLNISNFLESYGIYIFIFLITGAFILKKLLKKQEYKYKFDGFLLKLPLISKIVKVSNTARFARTFGILSSAGVPILDAMTTSNQVVTNLLINQSLDEARQKVKEGVNVSRALKETKYFPAMSLHLIASGENSGQLEPMLARAAEYQEKEIENLVATFISLFEPLMILVMGFVVLLIVLAILLPIFQMNEFVS